MRQGFLIISCCILGALVFSACDNTIEPQIDDGETRYAVHGFLDMRVERQVLRIESLRSTVLSDPAEMDGVEVITSDVESGQFVVWSDSVVTLNDGTDGTVYYADFKPLPGHMYRLSVGRPGEIGATATTVVPSAPTFYQDPVRGDSLDLKQQVFMVNLEDQPKALTMHYTLLDVGDEAPQTIPISYGGIGSSIPDGWTFDVMLAVDRFILLRILNHEPAERRVRLRELGFSLTIESREWLDLLEPANLTNAHGFFGSVGYYEHDWLLDAQSLSMIGFIDDQSQN